MYRICSLWGAHTCVYIDHHSWSKSTWAGGKSSGSFPLVQRNPQSPFLHRPLKNNKFLIASRNEHCIDHYIHAGYGISQSMYHHFMIKSRLLVSATSEKFQTIKKYFMTHEGALCNKAPRLTQMVIIKRKF